MITAEEARKITEATEAETIEQKRHQSEDRQRNPKEGRTAQTIAAEFLRDICKEIIRVAKTSTRRYVTITFYSFGGDQIYEMAYEIAMKTLMRSPYKYGVSLSSTNGFEGDDHNKRRIYLLHEWTVSW